VSFISLSKRFKKKSNLLRLIFFLQISPEFHFLGLKFSRFLRIPKAFFKNYFSYSIIYLGIVFSIIDSLFLSSVIGIFNYIKKVPFHFPSNTYSLGLANKAKEFVHGKSSFISQNSSRNIQTSVVYLNPWEVVSNYSSITSSLIKKAVLSQCILFGMPTYFLNYNSFITTDSGDNGSNPAAIQLNFLCI
jgi:hypothetical protein